MKPGRVALQTHCEEAFGGVRVCSAAGIALEGLKIF